MNYLKYTKNIRKNLRCPQKVGSVGFPETRLFFLASEQRKFNIALCGENFYQLTYWDENLKFGGLHFFRPIDDLPRAH